MVATCHDCSRRLTFDGARCPECERGGPVRLETIDHSPLEAQLLQRLRAATSGEFEIVRGIGHGGMARVYLAYDLALDRQVALKVLSPLFSEYPEIVRRFQQEARTAAQLSHPHIVPVFTVYQGNGLSFFTMPFVEGWNVRQILEDRGSLELSTALDYIRQAAAGLSYAHEHGVVHRDVKPENMLLEHETNRLMLTDFGLAKALGSESLTIPGDLIGTPQYMAPEQCESAGLVDSRSDQYSLALVAHEILAGEYPFDGEGGLRELLMARLSVDPPPLRSLRPEVPEHVSRAIERALARNPEERFPSIEAFVRGLAGTDPVTTSPHTDGPLDVLVKSLNDRVSRVEPSSDTAPLRERSKSAASGAVRWKRWSMRAAVVMSAAATCYVAVAALSRTDGGMEGLAATGADRPAPTTFVDSPRADSDGGTFVGPPAPARERTSVSETALAGSRRLGGDRPVDAEAGTGDVRSRRPGGVPTSGQRDRRATPSPTRGVREKPEAERRLASRDTPPAEPEDSGPDPAESTAEVKSGGNGREESGGNEQPEASAPANPNAGAEHSTARPPSVLLEEYRQALQREDIQGVRSLHAGRMPASQERFLDKMFENAESIRAEMRLVDLSIDGETATALVEFPLAYVLTKTRWSRKHTLKLRLQLEHGSGGWRITGSQRS